MKRSSIRFLLFPAIWLVLLLACGQLLQAAPPIQSSTASLRLINDSEQTICYVYISPITASDWGSDRLGRNDTISPGEAITFELAQDDYDVLLLDCDQNTLLEEYGLTIANQYDLRFTGPDPCQLLFQAGVAFHYQVRYSEALQQLQAALVCYQEVGDRLGEAAIFSYIGEMYRLQGLYAKALENFQHELSILQEVGDRAREGTALSSIGAAYRGGGHP